MSLRNLFKNNKRKKTFKKSSSVPLLFADSDDFDYEQPLTKPTLATGVRISTQYNPKTECVNKAAPITPYTPVTPYTQPRTPLADGDSSFDVESEPEQRVHYGSYPALADHGYSIVRLIGNTSQGQIFEGRSMQNKSQRLAIKKVDRNLSQHHMKMTDNGATVASDKNVLKHALFLNHCTVTNKAPGSHIPQFIDFFDDEQHYYLVMEYAGDMNLKQWSEKAFEHIDRGELDLKHYRAMVKFIYWQLSVLLYWLHNDMHMCHLNIKAENIMINNGEFVSDCNGKVEISRKLCIKLCDFSLAEIFKSTPYTTKYDFGCSKSNDISVYSNPKLLIGQSYSAQKADVWAMGILLYKLSFNEYPSDCLTASSTADHMKRNAFSKCASDASLKLICGALCCYEKQRYDTLTVLQSEWLNMYWQRYKIRIAKKTFSQRQKLNTEWQKKMMAQFPFYENK